MLFCLQEAILAPFLSKKSLHCFLIWIPNRLDLEVHVGSFISLINKCLCETSNLNMPYFAKPFQAETASSFLSEPTSWESVSPQQIWNHHKFWNQSCVDSVLLTCYVMEPACLSFFLWKMEEYLFVLIIKIGFNMSWYYWIAIVSITDRT